MTRGKAGESPPTWSTQSAHVCVWVLPTEGDVSDVVTHGGVRVLELQRWLPVAEQHLGGRVAGSPALLELLNARDGEAHISTYDFWGAKKCGYSEDP